MAEKLKIHAAQSDSPNREQLNATLKFQKKMETGDNRISQDIKDFLQTMKLYIMDSAIIVFYAVKTASSTLFSIVIFALRNN